jgi:hypothetical protein
MSRIELKVRFPNESDFDTTIFVSPDRLKDVKIFKNEVFCTLDDSRISIKKSDWDEISKGKTFLGDESTQNKFKEINQEQKALRKLYECQEEIEKLNINSDFLHRLQFLIEEIEKKIQKNQNII